MCIHLQKCYTKQNRRSNSLEEKNSSVNTAKNASVLSATGWCCCYNIVAMTLESDGERHERVQMSREREQ